MKEGVTMIEVVKVSQVTKKFGKMLTLNNISFHLEKGEIVGLIGPSGAGKTTLVKAMMGMEKIDEGKVQILDTNMPNLKVLQKIGYMAQADALYGELSGLENLVFFAKLYGIKKEKISERVSYAAKLVDLERDLHKLVINYSGGMKRRLSLAISLIQDPEILILDEPTVGIDPQLRLNIWSELKLLQKQGKSIIITTHVMDEAEKCDRLALIREGNIIAAGSPKELKDKFQVQSIEGVFLATGGDLK